MFFRWVSSVLLLDRSGNGMLCSMLFLSLGLDVLTDHFYWCPSCRQKTETLAPECFFPKFFPDFRIPFFQQSAAGTFISIDKFTEFRFRLCTKITCTWSISWFHSSRTIPYRRAIYSHISFALSEIGSLITFLWYFTTNNTSNTLNVHCDPSFP